MLWNYFGIVVYEIRRVLNGKGCDSDRLFF
jgi:hypothetical protein